MRHRKKGRKLSRTASHRKAMLRNMATSLFQHERVTTTEAKAKELRPYAERLKSASEGLNVEFVGRLDPEQMPAFLRGLDVLAITSVWPENCPYVVLETQAAGVAVRARLREGTGIGVGAGARASRCLFAAERAHRRRDDRGDGSGL